MLDFESMSSNIRRAYEIAKKAHSGQVDKAGKDYILHPMSVASSVGDNELAIIVALLHDVVEDTDITLEDLAKEFSQDIVEAVKCMTHDKDTPYLEYVAQVKTNKIAKVVKLADLLQNMDLSRLDKITSKDIDRLEKKYIPALRLLLS